MDKPKVAFICIHNSCRSQIAEALGKYLAGDAFESYSAGTDTKPQLNQDAVRLMKHAAETSYRSAGRDCRITTERIPLIAPPRDKPAECRPAAPSVNNIQLPIRYIMSH